MAPRPSQLRQSDGQTLASLGAVYAAVAAGGPSDPGRFRDWGILAASRFLGRGVLVKVLERFDAEGVWGVTPHLIPHFALHSQSGTLSQVLGVRGPNLGIGGGTDAAAQGFLMALTWLHAGAVPGVWLVLSGWTPEYVPDEAGAPIGDAECLAIALALGPGNTDRGDIARIRIHPTPPAQPAREIDLGGLAGLFAEFAGKRGPAREADDGQGGPVRAGSATPRPIPDRDGVGGAIVIARGCGVRVELEPAAMPGRRRKR